MKSQYIYGKLKQCPVCGTSFQKRDADSESYVAKYCSHSCRNKDRTKHKEKPCKQCGALFKPRRDGHNFCSKKCSSVYKTENYKPDLSTVINKKLASFCCGVIHRCLRGKNDKTFALLGYTTKELKTHLEKNFLPGMSWENYGKKAGSWSIDHTKPISKFNKESTIAEINSLENLKPMWHTQNCSKRNKWEEH